MSHAYDVKALAENGDHQLLPGMVCNVQIAGTTDSYQLVIPQKAVCKAGVSAHEPLHQEQRQ